MEDEKPGEGQFRVVLVMMLSVMSGNVMAEWTAVGLSEDTTIYVDYSTIRRTGDKVEMWNLYDLKFAKPFPGLKPYMSIKTLGEYDCTQERVRELYSAAHSGNMGSGDIIFQHSDSGKWEPLPPGSGGRIMWKTACGYSHSSIKRSRKERVNSAVHRIISVQYAEGEDGVRPILFDCYSTAVAAQVGLSDDLMDCIAQDMAFTIFATDFFQAMAKESNKTLVELQSPFSRADSSIGRITGALKSVGITDSSHSVELKEIARLSQAALQLAVDLIESGQSE